METVREKWPPLQPGDRVSTDHRFEIIRKLNVPSGQADLYLTRLVVPGMLLNYKLLNRLMQLLGEPRWLIKSARVFVLKIADPEKNHNLAREMRFLNIIEVDHPHLIRLYEHAALPPTEKGAEHGLWPIRFQMDDGMKHVAKALALEYLAGGSLNDVLKIYNDRLPVSLAVEITLQIANGLQSLHAHGIIHQDLSPGNVMLRRQLNPLWPTKPEIVLIDLGVADSLKKEDRFGRSPYGKQIYLAPERAEPPYLLHKRADVFSLGAVLYHMLACKPNSPKTSSGQIGNWSRTDFPELRDQVKDLSEPLNSLVMQTLDIDWNTRPSLEELCAGLRELPQTHQHGKAIGEWRVVDRILVAMLAVITAFILAMSLSIPTIMRSSSTPVPTVTALPSSTATGVGHTPTPVNTSTPVQRSSN